MKGAELDCGPSREGVPESREDVNGGLGCVFPEHSPAGALSPAELPGPWGLGIQAAVLRRPLEPGFAAVRLEVPAVKLF